MSKVAPFHSTQVWQRTVYHNDKRCTEGNNIEAHNRRPGTGGRTLCDHCGRLH
jgi:hypothetical protein